MISPFYCVWLIVKAVKDLLDKKEPDNLDPHNMEM